MLLGSYYRSRCVDDIDPEAEVAAPLGAVNSHSCWKQRGSADGQIPKEFVHDYTFRTIADIQSRDDPHWWGVCRWFANFGFGCAEAAVFLGA